MFMKTSQMKRFFPTPNKYTLQSCSILIQTYVLIFLEEETVDTCHSAEQAVLTASGCFVESKLNDNYTKINWHNTNKFTLKDLLLLPSS